MSTSDDDVDGLWGHGPHPSTGRAETTPDSVPEVSPVFMPKATPDSTPEATPDSAPTEIVPTVQPERPWPTPPSIGAGGQRPHESTPTQTASPPRRRPASTTVALLGALLVAAAVIGSAVHFTTSQRTSDSSASAPTTRTAASTEPPSAATQTTSAQPAIPSPTEPTPTADTSDAEALANLESARQQGLITTPLLGQWAAQLASKYPGISDPLQVSANGSHVFEATDIYQEYLDLQTRISPYANVVMLASTDFGKQRSNLGPYWVTLALSNFTSAADVRSWCLAAFPDLSARARANACTARQLTPPS